MRRYRQPVCLPYHNLKIILLIYNKIYFFYREVALYQCGSVYSHHQPKQADNKYCESQRHKNTFSFPIQSQSYGPGSQLIFPTVVSTCRTTPLCNQSVNKSAPTCLYFIIVYDFVFSYLVCKDTFIGQFHLECAGCFINKKIIGLLPLLISFRGFCTGTYSESGF
jgi:hypothetical protein